MPTPTSAEWADAERTLTSVTDVDGLPMHLVGLGISRAHLGDKKGAIAAVQTALERDPTDENVALNAGLLAESIGDLDLAKSAYARAILDDPELAGSKFWSASDRRVSSRDVVDAAAALAPDAASAAMILAFAGRPAELPADLAPSDRQKVDAILTLVRDGPEAARPLFERLLQTHPFDGGYANWLARISAALGDDGSAKRYARWFQLLGGGGVAEAPHVGADVVDARRAERSPLPPNYPWAVYGRRALRDLFVDGTLVIVPRSLPGSSTAPEPG